MVRQTTFNLSARKRGYHLITAEVVSHAGPLPETGILHVFIHHTSAGLTINENADPSVRVDFETAFNRLAPESLPEWTHTFEGADDMPAHIKASLTGSSVTIPVTNGKVNLGTWQGIYLCEFRDYAGARKITVTVYS